MINRLQLMKIHALLAAFILPVAVMFMVTGALYTWGIKGSYTEDIYEIPVSKAIRSNLGELTDITKLALEERGINSPEGKPKIKTFGNHFFLEWTGSSKDLTLEPTSDKFTAKLTIKNTSWYRNLVQLHKAKGGTVFKIYAVIFVIAIGLLLVSGFIMAWQTPKLKRVTLITFLMGIGVFIIIMSLS